jgi:hypothetical protein
VSVLVRDRRGVCHRLAAQRVATESGVLHRRVPCCNVVQHVADALARDRAEVLHQLAPLALGRRGRQQIALEDAARVPARY